MSMPIFYKEQAARKTAKGDKVEIYRWWLRRDSVRSRSGKAWCMSFQAPSWADLCPSPLQVAAKQAAAAATQTIAASQNAAISNKNPSAQQQLVQSCKVSTLCTKGAAR